MLGDQCLLHDWWKDKACQAANEKCNRQQISERTTNPTALGSKDWLRATSKPLKAYMSVYVCSQNYNELYILG